ncbi:Phosphoribosylanthranilate isomerase [Chlorobium limicola DSM 245]|uniref:N-(5'-phosphoribosyl)anthranilate isomerase n=2 Tax=Chlorobium limicola TaxID=1092 RepID=B3EDY4_CHLL2|nr:Phosphoribosylanthranilate isomerase [Chlorobium limicola DSM 245]
MQKNNNFQPKVMVKVKICGITRLEDALAACEAGADALGFNFSSISPRYIEPENAARIIARLPPFVACAGIFVEHSAHEINTICSSCRLQVAQLHSNRYAADQVREIANVRIIRVFRPEPGFETGTVRTFSENSGINTFLFDAYRPGMEGGTGERIEQKQAKTIFEELRGFGYAILAGGLNPENIASAIQLTRPWAVDTASGVESSPGIKSPEKIRTFIAAAKNACP